MSTSSPNLPDKQQGNPTKSTITKTDDITKDELIAAIASRREKSIEEVAEEVKPMLDRFDIDEIIAQQTNDIWF
jgi:uncharacterized membrane protein YheB (UPF0754 family)